MKKFNLSACILAVLAAVLVLVSILVVLIRTDVSSSGLLAYLLLLAVAVVTIVVFVKNGKLVAIVPVLAAFVLGKIMLDQANNTTSSYTVFTILIIALYVVSLVFAFAKNAKWAQITVLVISVLFVIQFINPALKAYSVFDGALYELAEAKANGYTVTAYEAEVLLALSSFLAIASIALVNTAVVVYATGLVVAKPEAKKEEVAEEPVEEETTASDQE